MRFLDNWIPVSTHEALAQQVIKQDLLYAARAKNMSEEDFLAHLEEHQAFELMECIRPVADAMLAAATANAATSMCNLLPSEAGLIFPQHFRTEPPSRLLRFFPQTPIHWSYSPSNLNRVLRAIILYMDERAPQDRAEMSLVLEPLSGGPIRTVIQINILGRLRVCELHGAYFKEVTDSNLGLVPFQKSDYYLTCYERPENLWPATLGTETLYEDLAMSLPELSGCLKKVIKE